MRQARIQGMSYGCTTAGHETPPVGRGPVFNDRAAGRKLRPGAVACGPA
jgi:hypothetical protein